MEGAATSRSPCVALAIFVEARVCSEREGLRKMLLDGLTFENVENLALSISPRSRSGEIEISLKPAYQQGEETIVPADHFDWVLIASVNKECEDPERVFGADDTRP